MSIDHKTDSEDGVVVLYKGGRLPSWDALSPQDQSAYQDEHVGLMLSIADEHSLMHLEGFRLMTPQQSWERFWTIEFPTVGGAQAWIEAEMAPPYGRYGFYEYYVSKRWRPDYFSEWVENPAAIVSKRHEDPRSIPSLSTKRDSVILLVCGRWNPESEQASPEERGDPERTARMRAVAREHGLMKYEAFKLIGPQNNWHFAWVLEFPEVAGAEAWIDGEVRPPNSQHSTHSYFLARRWAPDYFASWVRTPG